MDFTSEKKGSIFKHDVGFDQGFICIKYLTFCRYTHLKHIDNRYKINLIGASRLTTDSMEDACKQKYFSKWHQIKRKVQVKWYIYVSYVILSYLLGVQFARF